MIGVSVEFAITAVAVTIAICFVVAFWAAMDLREENRPLSENSRPTLQIQRPNVPPYDWERDTIYNWEEDPEWNDKAW